MWIATQHGFYSVVAHHSEPGWLSVRARSRQDLLELAGDLPVDFDVEANIIEQPQSDYRWRLFMPASTWQAVMCKQIARVDYTNFKDRVKDYNKERAHTYGRVWHDLLDIEREADSGCPRAKPYETPEYLRPASGIPMDVRLMGRRKQMVWAYDNILTEWEQDELDDRFPGWRNGKHKVGKLQAWFEDYTAVYWSGQTMYTAG